MSDFSPGAVLRRSLALWGRNFATFAAVVIAVQSPAIVLAAFWAMATDGTVEPSRALWAISSLLGAVASGALTAGALRGMRGEPARAGEMLLVGFRRLWMVIPVTVVAQVAVTLGLVLLVVPGLALAAGLWVAVPAAVTERWEGTSDALTRSWELTKGRRWKVLAVALVAVVVALGGALVVSAALEEIAAAGASRPVVAALDQAATAIAWGFLAVCAAVSYHDLRVAREGPDFERLAAVFE
ncbi:MAG TPA: hypothetical protein VFK90_15555 [Anaeromyxobacter sp.]|nr:hypothetical protein [Anaeromyxobacter sp.]